MTTESFVWKSAIRYLQTNGYSVVCACPPGATAYMYKTCNFLTAGKVDAPDIVFFMGDVLYFCECKGAFQDLSKVNNNQETDFEKLRRVEEAAWAGKLDSQLDRNFGISPGRFREFRSCVSYFGELQGSIQRCYQIAVTKSGIVTDL